MSYVILLHKAILSFFRILKIRHGPHCRTRNPGGGVGSGSLPPYIYLNLLISTVRSLTPPLILPISTP